MYTAYYSWEYNIKKFINISLYWRKNMLDKSNKMYSHTLAFDLSVWGLVHKWYPLRFPLKLALEVVALFPEG